MVNDLFEPEDLLRVMRGFNPWWGQGQAPEVPPHHRTAFGAVQAVLRHPILSRRAVLISGPRQTGKTTLLKQLVADHLRNDGADGSPPVRRTAVVYLSLEHPILKLAGFDAILRTYQQHVEPGDGPVLLLLDEVQHMNDWATYVKLTVDHARRFRIVATGSAALEQKGRLAESGVGRWITVPMPPLSFFESVRIRGDAPPALKELPAPGDLFTWNGQRLHALAQTFVPTLRLFHEYLLKGGFPETARLAESELDAAQRLLREDVVERVLKRDMTNLYGVRNVADLERLFIYLCMHSGSIISQKTVADALEVNTATVGNHLTALEQSHLVYRLEPMRLGGKRVLRAQHKYYLADAALRNAVLLLGREVLDDPAEMGLLVETAVIRHLMSFHHRRTPRMGYWRDAVTGREVDLVVKEPGRQQAVEVKYRADARMDASQGIVRYCATEKVDAAFWVTRQPDDIGVKRIDGIATPFLRIPAHILCYLLGAAEQQHWTN